MQTFNEFGISLVIGDGNWIGASYEQEFDNGEEKRGLGWKKLGKIKDIYLRIWIYKKVFVLSKDNGFHTKNKNKIALKFILGFNN